MINKAIICVVFFCSHCFSLDVATGVANQVLDIAGSVKSIFAHPPQINVDDYLNSEEQFRRAKSNFYLFLDKFSPKNPAFNNESFTQKGKFLFFNVTKKNSEEENLFNDMVDKVLAGLPLAKIVISAYDKTVNGLIKAIEDALAYIKKKESVFLLETIVRDFYEDFMSFFYNFERERTIVDSLINQYENDYKKVLSAEEQCSHATSSTATIRRIDVIISLLSLDEYLDEQGNYFYNKNNERMSSIDNSRKKVERSLKETEQLMLQMGVPLAQVYTYLINENTLSQERKNFVNRMNLLLQKKLQKK